MLWHFEKVQSAYTVSAEIGEAEYIYTNAIYTMVYIQRYIYSGIYTAGYIQRYVYNGVAMFTVVCKLTSVVGSLEKELKNRHILGL